MTCASSWIRSNKAKARSRGRSVRSVAASSRAVKRLDVELDWQIEDVGATPHIGPDRTLQIYRILLEACTNALKHGEPKRIVVALKRDGDRIEIALADNGRGFNEGAPAGRGLANMRTRAQSDRRGGSICKPAPRPARASYSRSRPDPTNMGVRMCGAWRIAATWKSRSSSAPCSGRCSAPSAQSCLRLSY